MTKKTVSLQDITCENLMFLHLHMVYAGKTCFKIKVLLITTLIATTNAIFFNPNRKTDSRDKLLNIIIQKKK